ncbi:MAG: methionyl-tRNA formyltransferase [Alphaproteobacteria bacterium]
MAPDASPGDTGSDQRPRLRIVFMGTPDFAVTILEALVARHDVVRVYSQPPRPAGRGQKERPSPVHETAIRHGIPVHTPTSLKSAEEQAIFASLGADVAVVAAYGLLLPPAILEAPRLGCLNVHASLLPRWRGAAPIHRAVMAGDTVSGVTIMRMDAGLDTGPMLLTEEVALGDTTTAGSLHDQLAEVGGRLIVAALDLLATGTLVERPQPEHGVTYAAKLKADDGRLDWRRPAVELAAMVRGLSPWPGAWLEHAGIRIKVLSAVAAPGVGAAGTLLDDRLTIACGVGALQLTTVQRSGRNPMDGAAFLRGYPLAIGTILE